MAVDFDDRSNKVIVNPYDVNKVIVQEQPTRVEIAVGGPQGATGPAGAAGATGPAGATGATGPQGEKGKYTVSATAPANPEVGDAWFNSTTSQMYIRYDGFWVETSSSYLGPATVLNIGTVTTGNPGSSASANITGTPPSQTLNLTIPAGATGAIGPGIASGGSTGQVLIKADNTNYNTTWADPSTIGAPVATRWSPTFQATGLTFTGSGNTYPTYNSYYVKFGQLVSFNIKIEMTTVTNFGTGQFKVDLPFAPISTAANHFSAWAWVDPSQPADELNGHVQMVADHISGSQTLDLHWLKETTANPKPLIESLLVQGTPVTFTTASIFYVNGTYISAS